MGAKKLRISERHRAFVIRCIRQHGLTLQHHVLVMSCWWRCSAWFDDDDDASETVLRVLVYLVSRYLGPRDFPLPSVRPDILKRVYFRCPGDKAFVHSPTATDVVMVVFLRGLDGRLR